MNTTKKLILAAGIIFQLSTQLYASSPSFTTGRAETALTTFGFTGNAAGATKAMNNPLALTSQAVLKTILSNLPDAFTPEIFALGMLLSQNPLQLKLALANYAVENAEAIAEYSQTQQDAFLMVETVTAETIFNAFAVILGTGNVGGTIPGGTATEFVSSLSTTLETIYGSNYDIATY